MIVFEEEASPPLDAALVGVALAEAAFVGPPKDVTAVIGISSDLLVTLSCLFCPRESGQSHDLLIATPVPLVKVVITKPLPAQ